MRGAANLDAKRQNALNVGDPDTLTWVAPTVPSGEYLVLDEIHYSYDQAPTGGALTVKFGGVTKWSVNVPPAVFPPKPVRFPRGLYTGTVDEALLVELAAGGGTVVGRLAIVYR